MENHQARVRARRLRRRQVPRNIFGATGKNNILSFDGPRESGGCYREKTPECPYGDNAHSQSSKNNRRSTTPASRRRPLYLTRRSPCRVILALARGNFWGAAACCRFVAR